MISKCKFLVRFLFFSCVFFNHLPLAGQYSSDMQRDPDFMRLSGAPEDNSGEWFSFQSGYFSISIEPGVDLKRIQKRINRRYFYIGSARKVDSLAGSEEKVSQRMDILLERVKELLGMYPSKMQIINLRVFKTRQRLNEEYFRLLHQRQEVKSFYIHRYRTIYVSEADINDSVMAHEIGHAVIDHYFMVIPPAKTAEMLASYVDLHLED